VINVNSNQPKKEVFSVEVISPFRFQRRSAHRICTLAVLAASFFGSSTAAWAQISPCDLNQDGVVNSADVTLAVNMALGSTQCTANVEGPLTCTVVTVQRVTNASLGQVCVTYNSHSVTVNWVASTTPNVNYNVYRGSASAGPYTKLNSSLVAGTTFQDSAVTAGQTFYYVATAVDGNGKESAYSSPPVQATIPVP
jgi:hypothetical protein